MSKSFWDRHSASPNDRSEGPRTFWDKIAGLYDLAEQTNAKVNAAARKRVGELVPAGARVLDCAAGTGEFSLAAAKRAGSVLCTDLSLPMLDKARKKAAKQGLSNITFTQRDITALSDPDGSFDAVIAGNVLHLLDDPEPAVRELWRAISQDRLGKIRRNRQQQ